MGKKVKPALDVISLSEGSSQLKVLSVIAEYQLFHKFDEGPRQIDITNKLSLTKGSVSNNCNELEDQEVVFVSGKSYYINKEVILKTYAEYIESLLIREPATKKLESYIDYSNNIRTEARNNLDKWISLIGDTLFSIILNILTDSRKQKSILNLREVFEKTNQSIRLLCNVDNDLDEKQAEIFNKIGIATNVYYKYLLDNKGENL